MTAGEKLQSYAACLREAAANAEMSFGDGIIKMTRELARAMADDLDQPGRDVDAVERVRDGRAIKIIHRGVVMINFDWWKRRLEAEGKWRCVPEIEDLEKADAEEKNLSAAAALSVAAATSPPEGETRGEDAATLPEMPEECETEDENGRT